MSKIIGIDLGTTNSEAAVVLDGRPVIIPSQEGQTLSGKNFPSVVAFNDKEERLVGELAKRQAIINPEGTIIQAKRKMGTNYKFKVKVGQKYKDFRPEEISSIILQKIKTDAEAYLGEPVKKAVITVPAYFNDDQRQATKDAGRIAGLEVLRIINEPTAAAIAYGLDKDQSKELKIIVLDFGGGTFDVTCMEMSGGVLEVISTSGDTQLGGSDMDVAVIDFLTKEILKSTGVDVLSDLTAMQRIREAAESAKIQLTSMQQTRINIPYLTATSAGPVHFDIQLTRAKLQEIIKPVIDRLDAPIRQALIDAKWDTKTIDKVVLVGGPTRMPIVREKFESIVHKKGEGGVDPMQCVALGAAIQAGILSGEVNEVLLLDVTPLTLSVEVLGGIASPLIDRNTTIPVRKSQIYSTASDNQPGVEIHITQGERKMSRDNKSLGRFNLTGIPPAPRGVPQIEVSFDIDSNGILNVTAKDLGTGKSQSITITGSSQLSENDIKRMVDDAKRYEEEDKQKSKVIEIRNNLESLIYTGNKLIDENKDKISSSDIDDIRDQIERSKKVLQSDDIVEIEENLKNLSDKLSKIGAKFYSKSPDNKDKSTGSKSHSKDKDDSVDVEYEVEEDK